MSLYDNVKTPSLTVHLVDLATFSGTVQGLNMKWTSLLRALLYQNYLSDQNLHPALDQDFGLTQIILIPT